VVLRAIQREESLRSSSIEGAYSTAEELLKYELQRERGRGDPEAVQREVHNYELALARGEREVREVGISHDTIRLLHEILMDHPSGEGHWPGVYRAGPVFIGADARFVPPPDEMVEPCLDALLGYIAEPGDDLPPDRARPAGPLPVRDHPPVPRRQRPRGAPAAVDHARRGVRAVEGRGCT
jgi:Fic family protein